MRLGGFAMGQRYANTSSAFGVTRLEGVQFPAGRLAEFFMPGPAVLHAWTRGTSGRSGAPEMILAYT